MLTTFALLFVAELGDKTQLAVISMTAKHKMPIWIFIGAALALASVTALGVLGGELLTRFIPEMVLRKIAAVAVRGDGRVDVVRKRSRSSRPRGTLVLGAPYTYPSCRAATSMPTVVTRSTGKRPGGPPCVDLLPSSSGGRPGRRRAGRPRLH